MPKGCDLSGLSSRSHGSRRARFGYRVSVQSPDRTPDFGVRAFAARIRVARGGQIAVRCEVDRRNGFDGMIRITADRPAGISAGPPTLGGGSGFGWLVLSATDNAPREHAPQVDRDG